MSYYVSAYKYGKKIKIPVEEQHTYVNQIVSTSTGEVVSAVDIIKTKNSILAQNTTISNDFDHCWNISKDYETAINNTVDNDNDFDLKGRKNELRAVDYTFSFAVSGETLLNTFSLSPDMPWWFNMRLMLVHFDAPVLTAYQQAYNTTATLTDSMCLKKWFNDTFCYYSSFSNQGSTYLVQSCHQNRMRESTKWTGKFKILVDKKFKMKSSKGVKTFCISLKPSLQLTYESHQVSGADVWKVSNDDFNNTYLMVLGPMSYDIDVSPLLRYKLTTVTTAVYNLCSFRYFWKYSMYDV